MPDESRATTDDRQAVHPGEIVKEWLSENRLQQSQLARKANISERQLSAIVRGKVGIGHQVADKLAAVTGISAPLLLNLSHQWRLARRYGHKGMTAVPTRAHTTPVEEVGRRDEGVS